MASLWGRISTSPIQVQKEKSWSDKLEEQLQNSVSFGDARIPSKRIPQFHYVPDDWEYTGNRGTGWEPVPKMESSKTVKELQRKLLEHWKETGPPKNILEMLIKLNPSTKKAKEI